MRAATIGAAISAVLLLAPAAWADTLKTEALPEFTARVMTLVGKADLSGAFATMQPYAVVPKDEFRILELRMNSQRELAGERFGKTVGYECFTPERRGEWLARVTCIERTERHALPWRFYFYRSPKGWVLNSFVWNDDLPSLFPAQ